MANGHRNSNAHQCPCIMVVMFSFLILTVFDVILSNKPLSERTDAYLTGSHVNFVSNEMAWPQQSDELFRSFRDSKLRCAVTSFHHRCPMAMHFRTKRCFGSKKDLLCFFDVFLSQMSHDAATSYSARFFVSPCNSTFSDYSRLFSVDGVIMIHEHLAEFHAYYCSINPFQFAHAFLPVDEFLSYLAQRSSSGSFQKFHGAKLHIFGDFHGFFFVWPCSNLLSHSEI